MSSKSKILLSDSAYVYNHRVQQNPPESRYIALDGAEEIIMGFLWEEPREIGEIRISLPQPQPIFRVFFILEYLAPSSSWQASRQYTWGQGTWVPYPVYARAEDDSNFSFPAMKVRTVALRLRACAPHKAAGVPDMSVYVYGVSDLVSQKCFIETGLWGCKPAIGEPVAYNGKLISANAPEFEFEVAAAKPDEGTRTLPDRTVVTLAFDAAEEGEEKYVSFLPADLKKHGYICIPDHGTMIWRENARLPKNWREKPPHKGTKILDRVRKTEPQNFERVLREVKMEPVKTIRLLQGTVPRETNSRMRLPDPQLQMQWDVGATHLLHFCKQHENGRWEVRNGPYGMLAQESLYITRILDRYKYHEVCRGGHETYLDSYSVRTPEGLFKTVEGCMCMPYGVKPEDSWLGLDPGCVLVALSEHYFITRDKAWLAGRADKLLGCCEWILREVELHKAEGAWDDGLLPPLIGGDIAEWFSAYYWNATYYEGLNKALTALSELDGEIGAKAAALRHTAEDFRQAIRKAYRRSIGLAPVEPLRDGTFVPGTPPVPYMRGFMTDIYPVSPVIGLRNAWLDIDLGVLKLIETGIFAPDETEAKWIVDVLEDRLMLDAFLLPKKWDKIGADPITASRDATPCATDYDPEKDWFSWGGTGWQNGYFPLPEVYVMLGEPKAFIRTLYNTYGIEADKDTGWFREHAASLQYPPKSFEEAQFLNRLLAAMVYENGDTLYLNGGVPETWYEDGFEIGEMPTYFGEINMKVTRDGDTIRTEIKLARTTPTARVRLSLRHPSGRKLKSLVVNGKKCRVADKEKSFAYIDPDANEWMVEAKF